MNADDRATPSSARTFTPVNNDPAQPAGAQATPAEAPASVAPTTGSIPKRAALRPTASTQYATRQTTSPAAQPITGAAPTTQQPAQQGAAFTAGAAGAMGAGMGKLKGYATKAKDSLTEGDDVTASRRKGGPRKARVLLSRIDPWSALKMGFLLSIALGIMMVVAVFVLWSVLNNEGVFVMINDWIVKLFATGQEVDLLQFTNLRKVMSATVLLAIINVVLLTALTTIGAFLYNIVSSIVGGIYVTLTDD